MLRLTEYSVDYNEDSQAYRRVLDWIAQEGGSSFIDEDNSFAAAPRLGCYRSTSGLGCGGWAGVVRLTGTSEKDGGKTSFSQEVAVLPRRLKNDPLKRVDLVGMYLECLENAVVAPRMGEPTVFIWHDQEPIECPEEFEQDALIFLVLSYLRELHQLCLRHLRNQFVRTQQNLTGKLKGRIDISKQFRINMARGRLDRTVCGFFTHSNNCRENQILKTALERSARLLTKYNASARPVWSTIHFCRNELGPVDEVEVTPRLFQGIRYTGLFRPYQKAHRLAKLILNALPPDPHSSATTKPIKVPPFAICTYELFERYCEVQLRKTFSEPRLWIGYRDAGLGKHKNQRLRPDFLLRSENGPERSWIIDAKNKPGWAVDVAGRSAAWDADVPQLCRYSRYIPVLDELGFEEMDYSVAAPKMLILYPSDIDNEDAPLTADYFENPYPETSIKNLQDFYAFPLSVPIRNAE